MSEPTQDGGASAACSEQDAKDDALPRRSEPALLPCPFCGSADIWTDAGFLKGEYIGAQIACRGCEAAMADDKKQGFAGLLESWNRRAKAAEPEGRKTTPRLMD